MNDDEQLRGGNGQYARHPDTAERDAEALRLRAEGMTYATIAARLGFSGKGAAWNAVQRSLDETVAEPADEVRQLELSRLDALTVKAWEVLDADHVVVSHGKVVVHEGRPLVDHGPTLQAIDRLVRIAERRARLLGLDSPYRVNVDAEQLYQEIIGILDAAVAPDDEPPALVSGAPRPLPALDPKV